MKDRTFWILAVFAAIYILGNIGTGSLTTWDEAVYANISREILRTGDWLVLRHEGTPWFGKPPFYIWCTALSYSVFGINEFSTRLPSALFAVATVMLIYIFVKKIANKKTAILASLLLLAMPHYLHYAKMGMMDVTLTFFITLMIYLFWRGIDNPLYLLFSGAVLAPAYLTKGFAAFLGIFIIISYSLLSGNWRFLLSYKFIAGLIISVLIILGWHLIQFKTGNPGAVEEYFGVQILKRATSVLEGHSGGINFYQKVIFNKNKPWSVLIYAAFGYMIWLMVKYRDKRAILTSCWIVLTYALYTAVRTKLHWYIIPIYPALAISSAVFLERFLKNKVFNISLAVILLIALIQAPVSYAFKLDLNPDIKRISRSAKSLHDKGAIIYLCEGYDDKELFYMGSFSKREMPYPEELSSKDAYCVVNSGHIEKASRKYPFIIEPIERSGSIILARIRRK